MAPNRPPRVVMLSHPCRNPPPHQAGLSTLGPMPWRAGLGRVPLASTTSLENLQPSVAGQASLEAREVQARPLEVAGVDRDLNHGNRPIHPRRLRLAE